MRWIWFSLAGLCIGIVLGSVFTFKVPVEWTRYVAVAILAALDTVIGAVRAGIEQRFDYKIFTTGLLMNALLAAGFSFLGEKLGIDLYLVVLIVFGLRIFQNVAVLRHHLLKK